MKPAAPECYLIFECSRLLSYAAVIQTNGNRIFKSGDPVHGDLRMCSWRHEPLSDTSTNLSYSLDNFNQCFNTNNPTHIDTLTNCLPNPALKL